MNCNTGTCNCEWTLDKYKCHIFWQATSILVLCSDTVKEPVPSDSRVYKKPFYYTCTNYINTLPVSSRKREVVYLPVLYTLEKKIVSIYRNQLLYRWFTCKLLYKESVCCVQLNSWLTDWFDTLYPKLKQGNNSSPILFSIRTKCHNSVYKTPLPLVLNHSNLVFQQVKNWVTVIGTKKFTRL